MEKAFMFLSFFLGFLSVVMAFVLSWNTNKLVRTEDERAKRMIDEGNKRTQEMIAETQKMIEKMDERLEKMDERHLETMRYLQQSLDYLGSLIKADGEKTRELINKILEKIPG
jgi:sensor histidine kinase YesM